MTDYEDDDIDDQDAAPSRRRIFRLVPLTMMMASLMLVIKVNELYIGSRQLRELYTARDASAEEKKEEAKSEAPKEEAKEGEKKEEAKPEEGKKDEANKEEAKEGEHGKEEAKKEEGGHGGGEGKPAEEPKTYGTGKSTVKQIEALKERSGDQRFSQNEMDLLQNLAKRRAELDAREKELDLKGKVLEATQKRIDDKIIEMKTLDTQLTKTIESYNGQQNAQIGSLVKIYENMKPAQAAGIFNELDLPILLEVIDRMSERKVSPILAQMDPKKARDVTQELAAMRKAAPKSGAVPAKK